MAWMLSFSIMAALEAQVMTPSLSSELEHISQSRQYFGLGLSHLQYERSLGVIKMRREVLILFRAGET